MSESKQNRSWFQKNEVEPEEDIFQRIKDMQYECILMERYLSNIGKEIPGEMLKDLSALAVFVNRLKGISKQGEGGPIGDDELRDMFVRALETHNGLSVMSRPANAISIRYTEFTRGFFLKNNPVVNALIVLTFLFLVAYILLKAMNYMDGAVRTPFLIISASGLGAGFYTLSTVRRYLINRSYNPRYNPSYIIRFLLGIAAGSILAFMFKDSFSNYPIEVLAVVGGFSADAVGVILTRISEVLISVFKGIDKGDAGDREVNRQEMELIKRKARLDATEKLTDIRTAAKKENATSSLLKIIDDGLRKLEKM